MENGEQFKGTWNQQTNNIPPHTLLDLTFCGRSHDGHTWSKDVCYVTDTFTEDSNTFYIWLSEIDIYVEEIPPVLISGDQEIEV